MTEGEVSVGASLRNVRASLESVGWAGCRLEASAPAHPVAVRIHSTRLRITP